ncbi:hypothetical protein [Synechococcus sp. UW179A]|uniref:hypothetical protein n=1 Tax=Synechococcus sp. UW179A TaxID=2575510 RepID=UPI000E0E65FA|nr:hypothetical protein [Synechococcus sp. UW179A]
MLIPLRPGELQKLIPAVATGTQFRFALGDPRKVLQRLLISGIGGVITLLISQSLSFNRWGSVWLIAGVVLLLYILWGPILEAGRRNASLRRYPSAALFEGEVIEAYTRERVENQREQADASGRLELVENRRTWMILELSDEDGYLGRVSFPMTKTHSAIRAGVLVRCIVLSDRKDFSSVGALTDVWLPQLKLWVGEYPYLLRPAFQDLCRMRLRKSS